MSLSCWIRSLVAIAVGSGLPGGGVPGAAAVERTEERAPCEHFDPLRAPFFGDLHVQGKEAIYFYTRAKVITSRWFQPGEGDIWHKD